MSTKKTDKTLQKCDELIDRLQELRKALTAVNVASNRRPVNALGAGWSQDPSTGMFHHSTHGMIATSKHPDGYYEIKHGGRPVGRAMDMGEAGKKILNYVKTLQPLDTGMHSGDPMSFGKDEEGMSKSNYGPKGAGQYSTPDNARRKAKNIGESAGEGTNTNIKAYSTKPGQLSAKQQASLEAKKAKALSGPVKQYSPAQIAAINEARKLKKNAEETPWVTHGAVPNADQELAKLNKVNPVQKSEDVIATQLANMMAGRAMLGTPPPRQPTDQEMFGHLVPSEQMIKSAEEKWNGMHTDWLKEAMKPISSRFASEEEEMEYWSSIKVADRDDGKPGY